MAGPPSKAKDFLRGLVPERVQIPLYNTMLNAKRRRRGFATGTLSVRRAGAAFDVHDGAETIRIPTLRRSQRYVNGIAEKCVQLAAKYGCPAVFEPGEGHTVLDVGANVGEFSRYCGARGARVFAFEPDPSVYACLKVNVASFHDVTALERALWSTRADLPFFSAFDTADSSLIQPDSTTRAVGTIDALPLDDVPELAGVDRIDLLKMDGEGAEPEILRGATRTLQRIQRVAVDCSPERAGDDTLAAVSEIVRGAGLEIISAPGSFLLWAKRPQA